MGHLRLNYFIFSFSSGKAGVIKGRFQCSFRPLRRGMAKTFNTCVWWGWGGGVSQGELPQRSLKKSPFESMKSINSCREITFITTLHFWNCFTSATLKSKVLEFYLVSSFMWKAINGCDVIPTWCLQVYVCTVKRTSHRILVLRGPFLERPGNLTGPKTYFEIKVSRKVGCVLTSNEVHFVSLADNFTVPFSKLLKLPSLMENKTA